MKDEDVRQKARREGDLYAIFGPWSGVRSLVIALVVFDGRATKKVGEARSNMKDSEGASKQRHGTQPKRQRARKGWRRKEQTSARRSVSTWKTSNHHAEKGRNNEEVFINTAIKMTKRRKKE